MRGELLELFDEGVAEERGAEEEEETSHGGAEEEDEFRREI